MQKQLYTFLIIAFILLLYSCKSDTQNSKEVEKIPDQVSLPKGLIKIPGYAYIDGRDLQATPPLTISSINIWNSYNRIRVICTLAHGTKVKILNAKYDSQEGRYYLNVQNDNCEGWVSDSFISIKKMEPVGDIF